MSTSFNIVMSSDINSYMPSARCFRLSEYICASVLLGFRKHGVFSWGTAAMIIVEQVSFWYYESSLGKCLGVIKLDLEGRSILKFLKNCKIDFKSGCSSFHSQNQLRCVPLVVLPPQHDYNFRLWSWSFWSV